MLNIKQGRDEGKKKVHFTVLMYQGPATKDKILISYQPMLKLTMHYAFHKLFPNQRIY
jgi:hypothetical protein